MSIVFFNKAKLRSVLGDVEDVDRLIDQAMLSGFTSPDILLSLVRQYRLTCTSPHAEDLEVAAKIAAVFADHGVTLLPPSEATNAVEDASRDAG